MTADELINAYNSIRDKLIGYYTFLDVADRDTVQEILDGVVARLSVKLDSYDEANGASVTTWLHTCIRNAVISWLREHGKVIEVSLDEAEEHGEPVLIDTLTVEHRDFWIDVEKAIRMLPPTLSYVAYLNLIEGYSYQEIADMAGVTKMTIGNWMEKAVYTLRRVLNHYQPDKVYDGPLFKRYSPGKPGRPRKQAVS